MSSKLIDLPKNWVWAKLIDICKLVPTGIPNYDGEREYYSTGSVNRKLIPEGKYSFSAKPSRANRIVKKNDILQAKMSGTNKPLLISKDLENKLFSTGFIHIRPLKPIQELSKYLFFYLQSDFFLRQRDTLATGSTQVAITDQKLKQIMFPLPPLKEQERIVKFLEKFLESEEILRQYLIKIFEKTKILKKSIFMYACSGELTKDWRKKEVFR